MFQVSHILFSGATLGVSHNNGDIYPTKYSIPSAGLWHEREDTDRGCDKSADIRSRQRRGNALPAISTLENCVCTEKETLVGRTRVCACVVCTLTAPVCVILLLEGFFFFLETRMLNLSSRIFKNFSGMGTPEFQLNWVAAADIAGNFDTL